LRKIVALLLAGMASLTYAQQPMGTDFKKLFLQALNSPSGKSRTDVTGPMADSIRLQTNSPNARVVAEVDTLKALPQEGCKRLRLIITTPGMLFETPSGSNTPLRIGVMLNICPDGQPPSDESIVSAEKIPR